MNTLTNIFSKNTAFAAVLALAMFAVAPLAHAADLTDYGYADFAPVDNGGDYGYADFAPSYQAPADYGYADFAPSSDWVPMDTGYGYSTSYIPTSYYASSYGYMPSSFYSGIPSISNTNTNVNTNTCNNNACNTNINQPTTVTNTTPIVYSSPSAPSYSYPVYGPSYPVYAQTYQPVTYDVCPNLGGYQYSVPAGYYVVNGNCYPQQNQPYVSLSAVPYTGLDLGFWGTLAYWGFLVLWCLVAAYLVAVKRVQNTLVSALNRFLFGTAPTLATAGASAQLATPTAKAETKVEPAPRTGIDPFISSQIFK
ncbi:MAG: hypothetical protein KGI70_01150 [Patescibacteria group bacterium]|nr:hypothetical protein [Patescibacteria group bacterium]